MKSILLAILCLTAFQVLGGPLSIRTYTTADGLSDNYINAIDQDKAGNLWIATYMGLNRFDGLEFKSYFHNKDIPGGLPFNVISCMKIDKNGLIYLGSFYGQASCFNPTEEEFKTLHIDFKDTARYTDFRQIDISEDGTVFYKATDGIYYLKDSMIVLFEGTLPADLFKPQNVAATRHCTWTAKGYCIEQETHNGELNTFTTNNNKALISDIILISYVDNHENIWFGGYGCGLIQVQEPIGEIKHISNRNIPTIGNDVIKIFKDYKSRLWVATNSKGLSLLDSTYRTLAQYSNNLLGYKQDGQILWCVGWANAVYSFNLETLQYNSYKPLFEKEGLCTNIYSIEIKGDTIFCGTFGDGLILLNKRTNEIISHKTTAIPNNLDCQHFIYSLLLDSCNNLWVGSGKGLYTYHNFQLSLVSEPNKKAQEAGDFTYNSIAQGRNGLILITTLNRALLLNTETMEIEDVLHKFPNEHIIPRQFFQDNTGHYWIASFNNLYRISNDLNSLEKMKLTNGNTPTDYFFQNSSYIDSNHIYLGSKGGVHVLPISGDFFRVAPPNMHVEVAKNYKGEHVQQLNNVWQVNYNDFPLNISFSSIMFNSDRTVEYEYKIEGITNGWLPLNKNKLTLHKIQSGKYTLLIKNTNQYGVFSGEPTAVAITVHPPFWQTLWFKVSIVILAVGFIVIAFLRRIRREKKQKQLLQMQVNEKTAELRNTNLAILAQKKQLEDQSEELQVSILNLNAQKNELEILNDELKEQSGMLTETNQRLTEANEAKNKLFSIIAHDIKNPFTVILNASKDLVDNGSTASAKRLAKTYRQLHDTSESVFGILQNLLNWSRTQSNNISYSPSEIEAESILEDAKNEILFSARDKSINIHTHIDEGCICFADEQMLRIVFRNILHNAVKFTPENGNISVVCKPEADFISISINDTGIGMEPETLQTLFSLKKTGELKKGNSEGTGFGLLIVKDFLKINNGDISVVSKKGAGSKFIIKLPRAKQDNNNLRKREKTVITTQNELQTLVLVEDNENLREQLKDNLSDMFNVQDFPQAQEALQYVQMNRTGIVLTDIMLGGLDGLMLCKSIKEFSKNSIPVVIMTGVDNTQKQSESYHAGADAFLQKPFTFEVLHACLLNQLSKYEIEKPVANKEIALNPYGEDAFISKFKQEIQKELDNPDFSIEELSNTLGLSRVNLYRKTKKSLGISPSEYMNLTRLQTAAEILKTQQYRVSEVAYMVGFSDPYYFSKSFSKHFGVSPSEYN